MIPYKARRVPLPLAAFFGLLSLAGAAMFVLLIFWVIALLFGDWVIG